MLRARSWALLRDPSVVPEQVFNASLGRDLTPVSEVPAAEVRSGWAPLLPDVQ